MTTTIVTRASKGGRLSFTDMDNNLLNLKTTADAAAAQIITYTKSEVDTAIGIETTRAIATETLKAPLTSPTFTGTVSGIDKVMVGLGNVDNTTDLLKPISTATQTTLNLKSNIITVSDDTTSNATRYLYFGGSTTGNVTAVSTSSTNLQYNPSSGTVSATNFSSTSDKTLKNNIKTISNSEEIISKINPVEFTWKKTGTKSYGVIAQELEDILPELIHTNNEGVKSVEYSALIGFLLASNKELLTRVSVLEMK